MLIKDIKHTFVSSKITSSFLLNQMNRIVFYLIIYDILITNSVVMSFNSQFLIALRNSRRHFSDKILFYNFNRQSLFRKMLEPTGFLYIRLPNKEKISI